MSSEEVDKLRASPNYSPVFRIIIERYTLDDGDLPQPPTKFSGEIRLSSFVFRECSFVTPLLAISKRIFHECLISYETPVTRVTAR